MTGIVETEWSGYHQGKDALRSEIWTRLVQAGATPREPFGHIPSFYGAERAAERLADLPIWQSAAVIKSNPDTAHMALRLRALNDGKTLYMAVPRLSELRCFVELDPGQLAARGIPFSEVAAWQGAMAHGKQVTPFDMPAIDLVLVGCVAVSRGGGRTGKGAGFADLELGILRALDLLKAGAPIVAAVHPLQIVPDERLPMDAHDSPLDWIITPEEVIQVHTKHPRPSGIDWPAIRPEQYESIPILLALASHMNVKVERQ